MAEDKRFIIPDYPDCILDTVEYKEYTMSSYYPHICCICDLLNELADENEQLTEENQQLIKDNKSLLKHCENHGIIVPLNYERYKKYVGGIE